MLRYLLRSIHPLDKGLGRGVQILLTLVVKFYKTILHNIPKDNEVQPQHYENLSKF